MPLSLDQFAQQLAASGLLAEADVSSLRAASRAADAEQFARELVKQKKLTAFQAQQIYSGKAKSLVLGNYVVLDKLGQGGMGLVLKAEHRRMKRIVALKVLSPAVSKRKELVARFQREVQAAARLEHPNIVAAYDADEANGTHFLVMQFVDGQDLSSLVKAHGPLPVEQAVGCLLQAARGLAFAHEQGVIHRDIKPANLLLDSKGVVKVLDMGLARIDAGVGTQAELTGTGEVMGTVDYMAPEQARNTKAADARSDIYSLGITLWYLLVGRPAYGGQTLTERLLAHQSEPIPSLSAARQNIPPALDAVFRKLAAKQPEDRFQTMADVIAALEACQRGEGPAAPRVAASSSEDSRFSAFLAGLDRPGSGTRTIGTRPASVPAATAAGEEMTGTIAAGEPEAGTDPQLSPTSAVQSSTTRRRTYSRAWWQDRRAQAGAGLAALLLAVVAIAPWKDRSRPPATKASDVRPAAKPERKPNVKPAAAAQPAGKAEDASSLLTAPAAEWSEPVNLGPDVNSAIRELAPSLTADERLLVFVRNGGIWQSRRGSRSEKFGPAERVAGPVGSVNDIPSSLTMSADGLVLAMHREAEDIWISSRATLEDPFGPVERLAEPVNTAGTDRHPVLSADGLQLAITSVRPGSRSGDVYLFSRPSRAAAFDRQIDLGPHINSPEWDVPCAFTPDGLGLLTLTQLEVFQLRLHRRPALDKPFDPGVRLPAAFEKLLPGAPCLSADGQSLYFHSHILPGGRGDFDLWVVHRTPDGTEPPRAVFPFNAARASQLQTDWAAHLDLPVEFKNSLEMRFRLIPPGEFDMGLTDIQGAEAIKFTASQDGQLGQELKNAIPGHRVRITRPFYMQVDEMTRTWYGALGFKVGPDVGHEPADSLQHQVAWMEAILCCNKLSVREGKRPAYQIDGDKVSLDATADGYRLPTEAQWEFACRAGTDTLWFFGNDKDGPQGNAAALRAYQRVHNPDRPPNPFGLFDLYAGSDEWCWDGYQEGYLPFLTSQVDDPVQPFGAMRVKRGGTMYSAAGAAAHEINSFARRGLPAGMPANDAERDEVLRYSGFGRMVLPVGPKSPLPRK